MFYVIFGCALFVFSVATILILHPQYEDGIVGKLGLACLALASVGRIFNFIDLWVVNPDVLLNYPRIGVLFWAGLVLFLGHHFYNFCRFKEPSAQVKASCNAPG